LPLLLAVSPGAVWYAVRHAPMRSSAAVERSSPWLAFGYYAACRARPARVRALHYAQNGALLASFTHYSHGLLGWHKSRHDRALPNRPVPSIFIEADLRRSRSSVGASLYSTFPATCSAKPPRQRARRTASPRPVSSGCDE